MIKKCKICEQAIDTLNERHGVFKDMDGKKEVSKGYYHYACFMERIATKAENKMFMKKAWGILNKVDNKVEEVIRN